MLITPNDILLPVVIKNELMYFEYYHPTNKQKYAISEKKESS